MDFPFDALRADLPVRFRPLITGEQTSIGFGPAIAAWRGRDGVEYRISWIPLGGYVLLPQLADLGPIEGESVADVSKLPPVSYPTKMIIFVAGATFNVIFAFLQAVKDALGGCFGRGFGHVEAAVQICVDGTQHDGVDRYALVR